MTAALERSYREALRWYPLTWRNRNEEAMVGTLLDAAEERGDAAPDARDLANLRLHGLGARFGLIGRVLTPAIRDRVSAIALATGFALSAWAIVFSLVNGIQLRSDPTNFSVFYGHSTTFGPFSSLGILLYATWVSAFVTALLGMPRVTRVLLAATLPPAIVARVISESLGMDIFPASTLVILLEIFAVLALLGTPRPEARWRIWLGAGALLAIGVFTLAVADSADLTSRFGGLFFERQFVMPERPWVAWIAVAAPLLAILCLALRRWMWAAVIAVSFVPWFALWVAGYAVSPSPSDLAFWIVAALVLAAAVAAISLRTAGLRVRLTITRAP